MVVTSALVSVEEMELDWYSPVDQKSHKQTIGFANKLTTDLTR